MCLRQWLIAFRYVSTFVQNNPTYEFYPKTDNQSHYMDFLNYTVPVNLFPLTWLMPGGKLYIREAHDDTNRFLLRQALHASCLQNYPL